MNINPQWLVNKIEELHKDVKDLKEIIKAVPAPKEETKYPINKKKQDYTEVAQLRGPHF